MVIVCLFLTFLASAVPTARADRLDVDLRLGLSRIDGYTTYRMGGQYTAPGGQSGEINFPYGELEFPMNVIMANVGATLEYRERLCLDVELAMTITGDAGIMIDQDRLTRSNPEQVDIYSEIDTKLDALIVDTNLRYAFLKKPRLVLSAGIGYQHQTLNFECSDFDKWYPSTPSRPHVYGSGKILTYDMTYSLPYALLQAECTIWGGLTVSARARYSNMVQALDKDTRLTRPRVAEGDQDGTAMLLSLQARYGFCENFFAGLGYQSLKIDADGTQVLSNSGTWTATTESEVESEQTTIAVSVGCTF